MRFLDCAWPSFLYFTLAVANSTITLSTVSGTGAEQTASIDAYSDINYGRHNGNVREPLSTITFGQTFGLPPGSQVSVYFSEDFHQDGFATTPTTANTKVTSIPLETATRSTSTQNFVGAAVTITKISVITRENIHSPSTLTTIITRQTVSVLPVPDAMESGSAQGDKTPDAGIAPEDPDNPPLEPPTPVVPMPPPTKWWDSQWVTIATWVLGMYVVGSGLALGWFWARGCIDTVGTWNNRHGPLPPSPRLNASPRPANYLDTTYQEQRRQQQPRFAINRVSHIPRARSRVPVRPVVPPVISTPLSPAPTPPSSATRRLRHPSFFGTVVPPLPPFTFPPPPGSVHRSRSNGTLNVRHPPLQPLCLSPAGFEYAHLNESTMALNTDYPRMLVPLTLNASSSHSVNGDPWARSVSTASFHSRLSSEDEMTEWTGNRIMHDLERMGVY